MDTCRRLSSVAESRRGQLSEEQDGQGFVPTFAGITWRSASVWASLAGLCHLSEGRHYGLEP